jgi:hypothetical protein
MAVIPQRHQVPSSRPRPAARKFTPTGSSPAHNRRMAARRLNDPIDPMTLANVRTNESEPRAVWNDFSYSRVVHI